ncbi:MAG: Cys-tRNA(Pro) deacylase [Myxococcales bacterium]|nr:Cys-tRNA(Pro) deacylase [Myxococcales bacterium]
MTPAVAALKRLKVPFELRRYTPSEDAESYGRDAADKLGARYAQVGKTLVAEVDGALVVAIVPVSGSLDLKALAGARGGKRARMADAAEAERATGYVVGGISPLGHKRRLDVVIDRSLAAEERVFVSAGRRGHQLELRAEDLVRACGASLADIARPQ